MPSASVHVPRSTHRRHRLRSQLKRHRRPPWPAAALLVPRRAARRSRSGARSASPRAKRSCRPPTRATYAPSRVDSPAACAAGGTPRRRSAPRAHSAAPLAWRAHRRCRKRQRARAGQPARAAAHTPAAAALVRAAPAQARAQLPPLPCRSMIRSCRRLKCPGASVTPIFHQSRFPHVSDTPDLSPSKSQTEESTEVVLQLDQEMVLSALAEALELLDCPGLRLPLELQLLHARVQVRLAYVLAHSSCRSTRSSELSQLANRHQQLGQQVVRNLSVLPSLCSRLDRTLTSR